jgi:hypothetical protein
VTRVRRPSDECAASDSPCSECLFEQADAVRWSDVSCDLEYRAPVRAPFDWVGAGVEQSSNRPMRRRRDRGVEWPIAAAQVGDVNTRPDA